MFAFTKEQRQAKLARTNVDNYNKLEFSLSRVTDSLQREAISNAMTDIVDIFTMLRSTYELYKPVRTTEDYRLLRVPGMPGIVLNYRWIGNDLINPYVDFYLKYAFIGTSNVDIKDYLYKAILNRNKSKIHNMYTTNSAKYGITEKFSIRNFNTLESLIALNKENSDYIVVDRFYLEKVCEQFAHNQNIDILISN